MSFKLKYVVMEFQIKLVSSWSSLPPNPGQFLYYKINYTTLKIVGTTVFNLTNLSNVHALCVFTKINKHVGRYVCMLITKLNFLDVLLFCKIFGDCYNFKNIIRSPSQKIFLFG